MSNYNKVILAGRLVREPETKFTKDGLTVLSNAIAVNRKYKDKEETMFIDFVMFGKLAENMEKYAAKGVSILIDGRLTQNRYADKEGRNISKHEIVVEGFQLLGGKNTKAEPSFPSSSSNDDEDIPF